MTTTAKRVQKHRLNLRKNGLRPVQLWVQDTRQQGFAETCWQQSQLLKDDLQEKEILRYLDETPVRKESAGVKRGDLLAVTLRGFYGKTCPSVVIQSDIFSKHPSVTVLPILPVIRELRQSLLFRVEIEPTAGNGLKHVSQVMVDRAQSVPADKIGAVSGRLDDADLTQVNRALAVWLGFA